MQIVVSRKRQKWLYSRERFTGFIALGVNYLQQDTEQVHKPTRTVTYIHTGTQKILHQVLDAMKNKNMAPHV